DESWAKAAELWSAILTDTQAPPQEPASVLYNLGVCYRNMNQLVDAAHAWEQCADKGVLGDEGQAASLGLAESRLADNNAPAALDAFARAVRDINGPADWHNSFVNLTSARQVFERGGAAYRDSGDYDSAIQLARLYEKLSPPGTAHEQRAQAAETWARLKKDEAAKKLGGTVPEDALALFRQA